MTNTLSAVAMEPASLLDADSRDLRREDGGCLLGERVYGIPCQRAMQQGCNGCHAYKKANATLKIAMQMAGYNNKV